MDVQRVAVFQIQREITVLLKPAAQGSLQGRQGNARPKHKAVFPQAYPSRVGVQGENAPHRFCTGGLVLGLVECAVNFAVLVKRKAGGGRTLDAVNAAVYKPSGNVAVCGLDVANVQEGVTLLQAGLRVALLVLGDFWVHGCRCGRRQMVSAERSAFYFQAALQNACRPKGKMQPALFIVN